MMCKSKQAASKVKGKSPTRSLDGECNNCNSCQKKLPTSVSFFHSMQIRPLAATMKVLVIQSQQL